MKLFRTFVWWLALPVRAVLSFFLIVVVYPLFPDQDDGLRTMLKELWTRP